MIGKMVRAARLDVTLYAEVEADKSATLQAMIVVILSSLAAGIGIFDATRIMGFLLLTSFSLTGWGIWAYMNYFIGTRLLREATTESDWRRLLRTMGFAFSPGLIMVLLLIPLSQFWMVVFYGTLLWIFGAMVIAVRQALSYKSAVRALAVTLIGSLSTYIILNFVILIFFGGPPPA